MIIDPARLAAFRALDEVTRKGAYANLAIKSELPRLNSINRAFCSSLFYGTLEKLVTLDFILDKFIGSKPKPVVMNMLRLGLYQLFFMDSVADYAACNSTVELAKSLGKGNYAGFINGVLRACSQEKWQDFIPDPADDELLHYSVMYSIPKWIVELWFDELGSGQCAELLSHGRRQGFTVRPNSAKGFDRVKLAQWLDSLDIEYTKGKYIQDAFIVKEAGSLLESREFVEGYITVQDEASMIVSKIAAQKGRVDILDACAAPGGKSACMYHFNPGAKLYSADVHQHRVELMEKQLKRLNVPATVFCWDAMQQLPFDRNFDVVLVDAPCSGLGTLFEQPDIMLAKSRDDIDALSELQEVILRNASSYVKPGGLLIYSTCTISKAENRDVVNGFLTGNTGFVAKNAAPELWGDRYDGCGIQLLPHIDGTSGFYISLMVRKA